MKILHLSIIAGITITITIMLALSYVALTTPHSTMTIGTGPIHDVNIKINGMTNKSTGDFMDFSANVPFHINATRGETLTIPVDVYGSTTPRSVDITISQADSRRGVIDPYNSTLPEGFSIIIPVKHIEMQAMDEKTHEKPLMTVNMTVSINNTVKSGTYGFAINMMSNGTQEIADDHASAFYVEVQ